MASEDFRSADNGSRASADYRSSAEDGARSHRSTPGLVADLFSETADLFSSQMQLVRTELSEKVTQGVAGLSLLVGGAVFLIGALNVALAAAVTAIVDYGIAAPWASLIVAAVAGLIGWLLVSKGLGNLKASRLAPERSANQLKRDAAMIKEPLQ
jgi:hypothetical protein